MTISLQLMGSPRVNVDGQWLDIPLTRPSMLLFYLAYYGDWISREELAFFFRPDADEATARHYVRKMLNGARQMAYTKDPMKMELVTMEYRKVGWVEGLEVEAKRLRWRVDTDVTRFRQLVDEGCWAEALKLYRGKLLSGLDAHTIPSFEAWLELEREELWLLWQEASLRYAADLEDLGQYHQAAAISKKLLQENSIAEEALQSYMRNAYLSGQREQALQAYEGFAKELRDELEVEPLETTTRLAEVIRSARPLEGTATNGASTAKAGHAPKQDDGQEELGGLLELLHEPDARLITLIDSGSLAKRARIIVRGGTDVLVAMNAIAQLAERMIAGGHHPQALELLVLIRDYTALHLGHHKTSLEATLQSLKRTQTLLTTHGYPTPDPAETRPAKPRGAA